MCESEMSDADVINKLNLYTEREHCRVVCFSFHYLHGGNCVFDDISMETDTQ